MNINKMKFGQEHDESLVDKDRVSCDGGQNGHPKIYLSVDTNEITVCPEHFTLKNPQFIVQVLCHTYLNSQLL